MLPTSLNLPNNSPSQEIISLSDDASELSVSEHTNRMIEAITEKSTSLAVAFLNEQKRIKALEQKSQEQEKIIAVQQTSIKQLQRDVAELRTAAGLKPPLEERASTNTSFMGNVTGFLSQPWLFLGSMFVTERNSKVNEVAVDLIPNCKHDEPICTKFAQSLREILYEQGICSLIFKEAHKGQHPKFDALHINLYGSGYWGSFWLNMHKTIDTCKAWDVKQYDTFALIEFFLDTNFADSQWEVHFRSFLEKVSSSYNMEKSLLNILEEGAYIKKLIAQKKRPENPYLMQRRIELTRKEFENFHSLMQKFLCNFKYSIMKLNESAHSLVSDIQDPSLSIRFELAVSEVLFQSSRYLLQKSDSFLHLPAVKIMGQSRSFDELRYAAKGKSCVMAAQQVCDLAYARLKRVDPRLKNMKQVLARNVSSAADLM